jgi:hypothetical protein
MYYLWNEGSMCRDEKGEIHRVEPRDGNYGDRERAEGKEHCCCPDYTRFEAEEFLREFEVDRCGRYYAATSAMSGFEAFWAALKHAFDFTDSQAIPLSLFEHVPRQVLEEAKERFGIGVRMHEKTASLGAPNPIQALLAHSLVRPNDSLSAYEEGGHISILPDFLSDISPDRSIGGRLEQAIQQEAPAAEIARLAERMKALEEQLKAAEGRIEKINAQRAPRPAKDEPKKKET